MLPEAPLTESDVGSQTSFFFLDFIFLDLILLSIMGQLYSCGTGHEGSHRCDPAAYGRSSWRALILLVGALPQDGLHT